MARKTSKGLKPKRNSERNHSLIAFREFVSEFKGESDRAAVILGAAKIDYLLYQILSKYLLPTTGSSDELLEGDSPLSTFSAKIHICYRLGLIDSEFARALHLIRRIRNSFAHEVSGSKLDSGPQRDRIRELAAPFKQTRGFNFVKKNFFADKSEPSSDFFIMLSMAVIRLDGLFELLTPLSAEDIWELCPTHFENRGNDEA